MGFEQILQQVADARRRAMQAAQQAQDDRRRRREENDLWVSGGVHWNGFGLESLIKMVAERSSPAQLNALAGEWSRHGSAVTKASEDLTRSLDKLMQYWTGTAADQAVGKVTTNARWIGELGDTAQQMSGPIMDASGALRSAQDTMPGMPKNNWLGTAGGGAAAGFMVAGPIGAAFGAAIGGIASVFGFGSKKKKMKRKAVQTMERYEGALLGIDQTTPQFGAPSDGSNPGGGTLPNPDDGIGRPGGPPVPPGVGGPFQPRPTPVDNVSVTAPSFAGAGPDARWQSLTGLQPGGGPPGLGTGGGGGAGGGLGGPLGGMPPGIGTGRGSGSGRGLTAGRGGGAMGPYGGGRGGAGAGRGGAVGAGAGGRGAGGRGAGGVGGRGAGGAGGRGAGRGGAGVPGAGMGGAGGRGDRDYRGRGRFAKTGALGGMGGGGAGGRRAEEEENSEHRRRVPIEEDPFSTDLKAAPPVIGL
ncbi:MAG: hypothetical protein WBA97_15480 [Actinophytocola sp.]|uniref:WXG100 family type VII secretion target n=1 Tax=Actinophytocola sp. TaxID=1872138 RepID=UPI003C708C2F